MTLDEAFEQLNALREQEGRLGELAARRDELEVEVIVAGTDASASRAGEQVAVGESRAARIVEIIDRRATIEQLLGRGEHNEKLAGDALRALQAGATALGDWLAPPEKPRPSLAKQLAPLVMLSAVAVTLYAAWALHWVMLIVLIPIAGAFSFLTSTGYDADFKRAGAQRRYQATGHKAPKAWEEAAVQQQLDALNRQIETAEASIAATAARPVLDDIERADLDSESESLELDLFSLCAGTSLDPADIDVDELADLRAASQPYRVKRDLERTQREHDALKRETNATREAIYKMLASAGETPPGGKADTDTLVAGLEKLRNTAG